MNGRAEDILRKVRALLAKAEGGTTEEEAEALRAKADELMTKYAIELWQVEASRDARAPQMVPVRRDTDISWWFNLGDREVTSSLWSLMGEVMRHTRCIRVANKVDYRARIIPVIGMPADLDYADLLFTHLMLQFLDKLDPKPRPGDTMIEAMVRMKEAGFKWEKIYYRLRDAGLVEDLGWWSKSVASKMNFAGKYTKYCQARDRTRTYTSPAIYRRSYVAGFSSGVGERFSELRRQQGQNTGSMALALKDYRQAVQEAVWDMFEDLRPHPADCQCNDCHFMKCHDPHCQRPRCKEARKPVRASHYRELSYDYDVMSRAGQDGRSVDIISNDPSLGRQKELS